MFTSTKTRNKKASFLLLTLISTTLIGTVGNIQPVQAAPVRARSADSFVDTVGVNVHLTYKNTAYWRYGDIIKPRLQELGVRHIRDGGFYGQDYFNKLNDLANVGIKSTLIFTGTPIREVLGIVKTLNPVLEAVEGPNETDLGSWFSYNGKSFPEATRDYQNDLYKALKGDPATAHLPIYAPSVGWGKNAEKIGFLSSLDQGNMHSYPADGMPPINGLDSWFIPYGQLVAGTNKPLVSTETGYNNALKDTTSTGLKPISETASSKYLPRLLLQNFNRNITRTFLYELINQTQGDGIEQNFGLLRHDGSTKPAFNAIKNLISLLKDPGTDFTTRSLDYSLLTNATNVHQTLLQKRDGKFYLILWQEAQSWDPKRKRDIRVSDQVVTLNLNTRIQRAFVYSPLTSTTPINQLQNPYQVILSVPDHPLVVELVP